MQNTLVITLSNIIYTAKFVKKKHMTSQRHFKNDYRKLMGNDLTLVRR